MSLCGFDLDELLAYQTPRIVIMKDRWLGLLRLLLVFGIFCFIFVYSILFQGAHLVTMDVMGTFRLGLRHPTMHMCDPFMLGCLANYTPMTQLPYCSESPLNYKSTAGKPLQKRKCQYWDYVEAGIPFDDGLMIPTRIRRYVQRRGCVPAESNGWTCSENGGVPYNFVDSATGGLQAPPEGGALADAKPKYDAFVAAIEHYTLLLDHGFRDGLGLQLNDFSMNGYWLHCKSADTPSNECERMLIVCHHSNCPVGALKAGDEEALRAKREQRVALRNREGVGLLSLRKGRKLVTAARQLDSYDGASENEGLAFEAEDEFSASSRERDHNLLLPGDYEGYPAIAGRVGDVFDIGSLLKISGVSLDQEILNEHIGPRRKNGLVLVISIEYTNRGDQRWLGLKFSPFSRQGPTPEYTYRVATRNASSFRTTRTYNDPADAERLIRVYNGIRVVVEQSGRISSFDMTQLLVTLTSALGLMAVATTVTDLTMVNCMRRKHMYRKLKYRESKDLGDLTDEGSASAHEAAKNLLHAIDHDDPSAVYHAVHEILGESPSQHGSPAKSAAT